MLLASPQRETALVAIIADVANQFPRIVLYFFSLYIFAAAFGSLLRYIVVKFKFDRNAIIGPFVKFDTPWYYLFSGYHEAFDVDGVVVSAIVEIDKTGYIYTGLLKEYFFAPDGTLERIVIEMAMRRPLSCNKTSDENNIEERFERFYKIDGDYFVLRYCEIKTLNIEFLRVQDLGSENLP